MIHFPKLFVKSLFSLSEDDKELVFILSSPRTGSTLLSSYLDSLKEFRNHGEILNPSIYPFFEKADRLPLGIGRKLALLKIKSASAEQDSSIKLIFGQLRRLKLTLQDLEKHFPTAKFILIYRESLIDCYVSLLRAQKTQEWHLKPKKVSTSPDFTKFSFNIDQEDFLEFCKRTKNDYIMCNSRDLMQRAIVVDYQSLADNPQKVFEDKICSFLNINFNHPRSSLRKQITKPLSEIIDNFNELGHVFESEDAVLKFDQLSRRFF